MKKRDPKTGRFVATKKDRSEQYAFTLLLIYLILKKDRSEQYAFTLLLIYLILMVLGAILQ